jgi:hypothetical protein
MKRIILAAALAVTLPAASAQAQHGSLTRSFVSSSGQDTNPCTITAPCQSFAVAYTKISANGIIAALDPGKYGPLTGTSAITGPVTINGNGWAAITGPAGATAITINAGPNDAIKLSGLEIDGANAGTDGIAFGSGASLIISNCVIRQFAYGIVLNAAPSNTELTDSTIENNLNTGILDAPIGGGAAFAFDHVRFFGNATGMSLQDANAPGIYFTASGSDSVAAGGRAGFDSDASNSYLFLDNVRVENNTTGISDRAGAIVLSRSALSGNGIGYNVSSNGSIQSMGNNLIGDSINQGTLNENGTLQ